MKWFQLKIVVYRPTQETAMVTIIGTTLAPILADVKPSFTLVVGEMEIDSNDKKVTYRFEWF